MRYSRAPNRLFVLALVAAAVSQDIGRCEAKHTALLSPTLNSTMEKRQLDELEAWATKVGACEGKRCDDLGCSCTNPAKDYVTPMFDGPASWLVLFCVEWADRCRKFRNVLDQIAPDLHGLYKVGYIDAEENPGLALAQLGIHVYPTLLAFPRGFGGGHEPLEYDRPKGSPGKVGSWALGLLPNRVVQVSASDDLLRATSSKHVAVLLFNDKSVTPAGFKATALRHAHPLAHSNSKHLRFAEVRKSHYAQNANGEDGTDLSELVRKFGPGMDPRQWPQIVIVQKLKKSSSSKKFVVWESARYTVDRFMSAEINNKKGNFYANAFEGALQSVVAALPQPPASTTGTSAQPPESEPRPSSLGYTRSGAKVTVGAKPKTPATPVADGVTETLYDCHEEGPWECFGDGCTSPKVSCYELAFNRRACAEEFDLQNLRGNGAVPGRLVRDACRLSCGMCKQGNGADVKQPTPSNRIPAHTKSAQAVAPPPPPPPSPPPPDRFPKTNAYYLTDCPVTALRDGLFVATGTYNEQPMYRRVSEHSAKKEIQAEPHASALYWHAKQSMWVFHATFSESAGVHGLGHAQFKTRGTTADGLGPPVGMQTWSCWLEFKWKSCNLTLNAMQNPQTSIPSPAPKTTAEAAEQAQRDEIERAYQKQRAAADTAAKRKHSEAAEAANEILEERQRGENLVKGTTMGGNAAVDAVSDQEQEEMDMAARIESLENLFMQGKVKPIEYEAQRAALVKQGAEQQSRRLQAGEVRESSELEPKIAMRRLRLLKIESEATVLNLGKQLSNGELSLQAYEAKKAQVQAELQREASRLEEILSVNSEDRTWADTERTAARNAEMLRKVGDERRAAAEAAQEYYADRMEEQQVKDEDSRRQEKLRRHIERQKELQQHKARDKLQSEEKRISREKEDL